MPVGPTRAGLEKAAQLPLDAPIEQAVRVLGNGDQVTCRDTVPLCLWCAGRYMDSYVDALWTAAEIVRVTAGVDITGSITVTQTPAGSGVADIYALRDFSGTLVAKGFCSVTAGRHVQGTIEADSIGYVTAGLDMSADIEHIAIAGGLAIGNTKRHRSGRIETN
jgi:hypothetical protein